MVNIQTTSVAADNIAQWKAKVALLELNEQNEIFNLVRHLDSLLTVYQSSAALAMVRMSLEIAKREGL